MSTSSQSVSSFGTPGEEKEPMLLLDTTGSMNYPTEEGGQTKRRETIQEAIALVVAELAKEDSQAAHEEEGGGLRTVTFAGGDAYDIEDLNPDNLHAKWGRDLVGVVAPILCQASKSCLRSTKMSLVHGLPKNGPPF